MNKDIYFYPTFEKDQYNINIEATYSFKYINKRGEEICIKTQVLNDRDIVFDSSCEWDNESEDLYLDVELKISNFKELYGINGVAPSYSKLGVALEWFSHNNKIRKILDKRYKLDKNLDNINMSFSCLFNRETFDSNISINILLYLAEEDEKINYTETFLNNEVGVILGIIDSKVIHITGTASIFPIFINPSKDSKLWTLNITYTDPTIDQFIDTVNITFNSNHKDFPLIDSTSNKYCEPFVNEIVGNAITLLITKLAEDGVLQDMDVSYDDGSVMGFVTYLKNVINLDFSNSLNLSNSIRDLLK